MTNAYENWIKSINWQVDFYRRSTRRCRKDSEFDWTWYRRFNSRFLGVRRLAKNALCCLGLRLSPPFSPDWLHTNGVLLWEARAMLADDLSKLLFDQTLVLRSTDHGQFYFPRIDFEDLVEVLSDAPFHGGDLPGDYLGLPLRLFDIRLCEYPEVLPLKIVTTKAQLTLLNSYRQYFVRRKFIDISPTPGDVVLDCGACIGELSVLFAGLVGARGEVHLFDPIPLHARYCKLQAEMNPLLAHMFHVNILAVGDRTCVQSGVRSDSNQIAPGGLQVDSFSTITLDDYASKLRRVDFVKMDIEGAEIAALNGAANLIREFKPRLAISAYHRPEDFWEIPNTLKSLNPGYELGFGHHSPIAFESVFYATHLP